MPRQPSTRPTQQPRSLRTQQRILAAMEALLADSDAEAITMEAIAERAHVSVGAIYKRFQGKGSLLPLVLERVHDQQMALLAAFLAEPHWANAGLGARIDGLLALFARSQRSRQRLIRALVVGHWQSAEPHAGEQRAADVIGAMHRWLAERIDEIDHPDPRRALSLGLYTTLQTLQTAILFDRVPPDLGDERFVAEMALMFRRYLGLRADNGGRKAP